MSDTRAAIRELRSLSEKRSTQGLTEQERSRLAELRERLGLPSEPAEVRTGSRQPGGTAASSAPQLAAPATPRTVGPPAATTTSSSPVAPAALPRLGAPEPALLPDLGTEPPEAAPAGYDEASAPLDLLPDRPAEPAEELLAEPILAAEPASQAEELLAEPILAAEPASQAEELLAEPILAAEPASQAGELLAEPILAAEPFAPVDLVPQSAPPGLEVAAEVASLPLVSPSLQLELASPSDATTDPAIERRSFAEASAAGLEPGPESAAGPPLDLTAPEPVLMPLDVGAVPTDAPLLPPDDSAGWTGEEPQQTLASTATPEVPGTDAAAAAESIARRSTLAERIDAAVEVGDTLERAEDRTAEAEWGAMPLPPEPLPPEPLVLQPPVGEDLGATPLDVADPASEFGLTPDAAPIELSSTDVILLESESTMEAELGGQPADPVPLAELHEFVGAQPEDPRALAFDDAGEQPTFAPEDLQATEAELAAEPQAFQPAPVDELPELEAEPPAPPPAAPRITLPRPPPGPPPPRPAAAMPPPEPAVAPAPPRAPLVAAAAAPGGGTRAAGPPPPPPAAYVLGEDGRKLPALSAARPDPPQLAHQFGHSGPFARNRSGLLAQASLDVMEDAEGGLPEPPPPPPPPATDVATGAEVFGGTYLNPTFVEGEHRVVLHTLEGQVRRGTVRDLDLLDPVIRLAQPGRPPEAIATDRVKAIFFMQEPGTAAPPSTGRRIRVAFADGRQIVGFSEDVDAGEQGFFLVPADTRTHTARIYVFRAGIQSISAA